MLNGILQSAISGLSVSAQSVAVAADNIANVSTTGYKRGETVNRTLVTQQAGTAYSAGGVQGGARQLADVQGNVGDLSSTDLGTEFVRLITAQSAYSASLKVLEAGDQMSRSLLDIRA